MRALLPPPLPPSLSLSLSLSLMDPSSVQWWLEYEIVHKQYWIVIYSLITVINTSIIKFNKTYSYHSQESNV